MLFKRLAFSFLRPALEAWLRNRAFHLSAQHLDDLSKRLSLPVAVLETIENEIAAFAVTQVDRVLG